ncbi:MAG TPA: MHS family MFS transporter [Enteractinococcus helveticum]|uniref:Putative proline/betaine transporter n=1 Tax=Enteractinococcus helveticum TaxID=1837282 RepID=A0A921FL54_9MICC|nr:MFS transporter [Enteractinococcus helveticum]HJF14058.1 MHS family MFS transporter [Enteractinococcus helveticum]
MSDSTRFSSNVSAVAEADQDNQTASAPTAKERRRVLGASLLGTAVEWYDFFIYGSAAALIFGPQFFPTEDPLAGTLAAFATFAVGFIARPLGGVIMGHYGDRVGRKSMLMFSMMLMGVATVGIGLLPNYAAIGMWAPILLVLLRLLQGVGVGGEWGGAVLMAVEYSPSNKRALYGAFPQMGLPIGIIASNIVFIVVTNIMAPEMFQAWGWRIPFLFSAVLVGIALWIRLRVEDSPAFKAVQSKDEVAKAPLVDLLKNHLGTVLLAGTISIASPALGYLYSVWMLSHRENLGADGVSQNLMLALIIWGAVCHLVTVALGAVLADKFTQKRIFLWGAGLLAVFAFPFFWLVDTGAWYNIAIAFALMLLAQSLMAGPQAALVAELFPAEVRYSGASVAYQIGSILGGGFMPLIATSLYAAFNDSWPIATYMFILAAVSFIAMAVLKVGKYRASVD